MTPIDKLPVPLRLVAQAAWAGDATAYEAAVADAVDDEMFEPEDDDDYDAAFELLSMEFKVHGWNDVPPAFDRSAAALVVMYLPDALTPPYMVPIDMLPQYLRIVVETAWGGRAHIYQGAIRRACEEQGIDDENLALRFHRWGWDGLPTLYRGDGPLRAKAVPG